jgi:hypothetical protein
MKTLELAHADTCLSCFWSGHHLPHIQIPVYKGIHFSVVKELLHDELNMGALMGSNVGDDCWSSGEEGDKWYKKAHAAINRIQPAIKGKRRMFEDLDKVSEDDDNSETVYAYFVFIDKE